MIERHHAEDAEGEAAIIRLADMLAHYALGGADLPGGAAQGRAAPSGVKPQQLRTVMYDLPLPALTRGRPRQVDPCPMSERELEVVRRLARGMVYKQIASELGLSTSTIRTHLHNIYGKLGARGSRPGRADRDRAGLDLARFAASAAGRGCDRSRR